MMAKAVKPNPLSLHIPEARFRPGNTPDFGYLDLLKAGEAKRPAVDAKASATRDLAYGLVREYEARLDVSEAMILVAMGGNCSAETPIREFPNAL